MGLAERIDVGAGYAVERLVVAHHRRRLRRAGHLGALDAPADGWAGGDPPPRSRSALEVLVDGEHALPRIAEAIGAASERVWIAGWFFSPDFRLRRDEATTLRDLLAEAAQRIDVRLLGWAGSPLPLFRPDRGDARAVRDAFSRGTRVRMALDARERPMHCHHEKVVVVDEGLAFVGGIDLTSYAGDRWDARHHAQRGGIGWHDATALVRGDAAADVAEHFRLRWQEVTGEALAPVRAVASGELDVHVVRTVPEGIYGALPHGDFRILESYLRALRSARHLIYLENQFLWSPEIVEVLARKLREPPSPEFRLVVLLPARPNNGQEDTRGQLAVLDRADGGAGRFLACTLYQPGSRPSPVYVHAKIGIVDDHWLTLGSANLNEHSLFNDTEMNVVVRDTDLARGTRLSLWAEHLGCTPAEVDRPPHEVVDELLRPAAEEGLERLRRDAPLERRLVRLPDSASRLAALLGPINGLLVDG